MIIKRLLIFFFALVTATIIGCNSEVKVNDNVDSPESTSLKIQELSKINLPFSSLCGEDITPLSIIKRKIYILGPVFINHNIDNVIIQFF
jgi:hypothetical protein